MRFPDFFIVGAAKSGTTSLWQYLGQHPSIFMTKEIQYKELGYFCFHYGIKNLKDYQYFFKDAASNQLIGEACNTYLSSPESAKLIHDSIPSAKIIIVIRNPAQRAFSLYNWMAAEGYESAATFEDALELENKRVADKNFLNENPGTFFHDYFYFHSGLYHDQIKRYFDIFGREKCLIHTFDELKKDPMAVVKKTFSFLEVDSNFTPVVEIHNEGRIPYSAKWQYKFKQLIKKNQKGNIYDKSILSAAKLLFKLNLRRSKGIKMQKETQKKLKQKFREDILATSSLIGKDLSNWLQ